MAKENIKTDEKNFKANDFNLDNYLHEKVEFYADEYRYNDDVYVSVDGHSYLIKRGATVMIPRYIKMAIENSDKQKKIARQTKQTAINNSGQLIAAL